MTRISRVDLTAISCLVRINQPNEALHALDEFLRAKDGEYSREERKALTEIMSLAASLSDDNFILIEKIIDSGIDINSWDKNFITPLAAATFAGNHNIVRGLIAKGASVNSARTAKHRTLLMHCSIAGDAELVKLLIEQKIDLDEQDREGNTALIHAIGGNSEVVKLLIAAGANIYIRNDKYRRAFDCAWLKYDLESMRLIFAQYEQDTIINIEKLRQKSWHDE